MSFRAVKFYLVQLFIMLFLTACSSGSSEDTGNTVTGTSGKISLAVLNASNSPITNIEAGDTVTAQVKLTNTNGLPVSGNQISFTTSSGTLSAESRLTNSDGIADVVFNSTGLSPSVITITATTTYNNEQLSINSQFEINAGGTPTVSLSMAQNGTVTNRVKEGETAQVKVKVLSKSNAPIVDTLVTFTAGIGTLTPTTALTNSNGEAEVLLQTVAGTTGASQVTAAITIDGQTTTSTPLVYEVQPLGDTDNTTPTITLSMELDGTVTNRIKEGETAQVKVKVLSKENTPLVDTLVTFSAGLGTLSPTTALTNSNGEAQVSLQTAIGATGASQITAAITVSGQTINSLPLAYEVQQLDGNTGDTATVSVSMEHNGTATNRIREGEAAQVKAKVLSTNGTPLVDTLVTFTAGIGTLSPTTALTNSSGEAQVSLQTAVGTTGASQITAAVTINEQTINSQPFAYEIQKLDSAVLTLAVLDQNNAEVTSITEGNKLSLSASLVGTDGVAISQQAIQFTASAGTLTGSKLTGSTGLAIVPYDSAGLTAGVVTVTATTTYNNNNLSVTKQFEVLQALNETTAPKLTISFKKDGSSTNRIQVSETAQIGVLLTSPTGTPLADNIVTFTADLGTLSAPSALTNSSGIAEVTITGAAGQLGAGMATASTSINNSTITSSLPYEVVDSDVVTDTVLKLGYLDSSGNFQSGIKSKLTNTNAPSTISAGGSLGLELGIFDQNNKLYTPPLTVAFASTCVTASTATIDTNVTTINGIATATFEDIRCATAFGNEDTVVATVTINSADLTATHKINISPEKLGSIEFVSATPQSIVIKGTGGQGNQETSTLTFSVKGELGNSLAQQNVSFSLNTEIGGLSLASNSGVTNSQGLVSAKVISGTVPTAVRVTASVSPNNADTITTQSDLLSVNTGLPDQNSITLALAQLNPEAFNRAGILVGVTAYLADSFNNPVPNGTTVNFTAESGSIESTCNTTNGQCSVNWKSQEPYEADHRVTILATAIGHESFVDVNGNNFYDTGDGNTVTVNQEVSSGFGRQAALSSGFVDMSEAWVDYNENRQYDAGERFIDGVTEGASLKSFDKEDGKFNGPQCEGSLCASAENKSIIVRKAAVLVTSGSVARYRITNENESITYAFGTTTTTTSNTLTIANGVSAVVRLKLSDTADQTLPIGTVVTLTATGASLVGSGTVTVPNTIGTTDPNQFGGLDFNVSLLNEVTAAEQGQFVVNITTPAGIITQVTIPLTLAGP